MSLPYFNLPNAALLFFAALLGGALNAVAGGGSFITFPTLLFTGIPAIPANATNTVALWTGLTFSGGAFRHHLKVGRTVLISLVSVSLAGGILGALLLLRTPAHTFLKLLPWLMLFATMLFGFGGKLTQSRAPTDLRDHSPGVKAIVAASCFQLLVGVYGGYFGGGMGFVILAMLAAFGMTDVHEMNALKIILSASTNGIAVIIFIVKHAVFWPQALVMIGGAALGGYFGAHYSLQLSRLWVRKFVIAVGVVITAYFFVHTY